MENIRIPFKALNKSVLKGRGEAKNKNIYVKNKDGRIGEGYTRKN